MFQQIEHFIADFQRFNRKKKFDIILRGIDIDNLEILSTNISLTRAVQKFILSTKRFSQSDNS